MFTSRSRRTLGPLFVLSALGLVSVTACGDTSTPSASTDTPAPASTEATEATAATGTPTTSVAAMSDAPQLEPEAGRPSRGQLPII